LVERVLQIGELVLERAVAPHRRMSLALELIEGLPAVALAQDHSLRRIGGTELRLATSRALGRHLQRGLALDEVKRRYAPERSEKSGSVGSMTEGRVEKRSPLGACLARGEAPELGIRLSVGLLAVRRRWRTLGSPNARRSLANYVRANPRKA
jgi:hypothetical protein